MRLGGLRGSMSIELMLGGSWWFCFGWDGGRGEGLRGVA